jgi:hypothetical protein
MMNPATEREARSLVAVEAELVGLRELARINRRLHGQLAELTPSS